MQNEKLLLQSPLGDINIMVLFMLHCSGNNILINTGHGNTRKIIEISCPVLSKIEYKGLSGKYMFLLVTIIFQVFSGKARKNEKH